MITEDLAACIAPNPFGITIQFYRRRRLIASLATEDHMRNTVRFGSQNVVRFDGTLEDLIGILKTYNPDTDVIGGFPA
jgi:hypothetical protein